MLIYKWRKTSIWRQNQKMKTSQALAVAEVQDAGTGVKVPGSVLHVTGCMHDRLGVGGGSWVPWSTKEDALGEFSLTYLCAAVGHPRAPESLSWDVDCAGEVVGTGGGALGNLTFKK